MINNVNEQLLEFLVLIIATLIYVSLHYLIKWLAVLVSGQKSGIIRGILQGGMLGGVFAISAVCFFNGDIKYYHLITYLVLVLGVVKLVEACNKKIQKVFIKSAEKIK